MTQVLLGADIHGMDEQQIERLIADLRSMMSAAGFGWAVEQADAGRPTDASPYLVARSLIDAAEAVTIDLAEAEIRTMDRLDVDDIHFKADDDDEFSDDPDGLARGERATPGGPGDEPRGRQRRAVLADLAGRRPTFEELRRALDVGG